jgi:hypothetical protein
MGAQKVDEKILRRRGKPFESEKDIGARVVRGPDWTWGEQVSLCTAPCVCPVLRQLAAQDGGAGREGTVVAISHVVRRTAHRRHTS